MEPDRYPVEIANLAEVERAVAACVEQGRSLRPGLVLGLHGMLMTGVPETPKRPLKPGRFRDATDEVEAAGVEYLTKHLSPAWRVEADLTALADAVEQGRLDEDGMHAAGRFHYRFVRIHPFCDGNGRMARALSTFLLAKEDRNILTFEKPLNRLILDHREDYVGVLEYCDGIYEDLRDADMPEEEKLRRAEEAFCAFHTTAYLAAYREHNEIAHRKLEEMGLDLPPFPPASPGLYDLRLETIKESHPWDETIKEAAVLATRQDE